MTATVVHWLLYLLLFVIPILGWANCVGYIGGTTVGVGNNGFYWKSIESGQLLQLSQLCCLRQRRRKEGKGGKAARMYAKAAST
jgi:hypothetical protein